MTVEKGERTRQSAGARNCRSRRRAEFPQTDTTPEFRSGSMHSEREYMIFRAASPACFPAAAGCCCSGNGIVEEAALPVLRPRRGDLPRTPERRPPEPVRRPLSEPVQECRPVECDHELSPCTVVGVRDRPRQSQVPCRLGSKSGRHPVDTQTPAGLKDPPISHDDFSMFRTGARLPTSACSPKLLATGPPPGPEGAGPASRTRPIPLLRAVSPRFAEITSRQPQGNLKLPQVTIAGNLGASGAIWCSAAPVPRLGEFRRAA